MARPRTSFILLGTAAAVAGALLARDFRGLVTGRRASGGILVGDVELYDALAHRFMLGSLLDGIAADVTANTPDGARILEIGCGPGRLSIRLARQRGFDVTGLDLDPAMIERARANAERVGEGNGRRPSFLVADVASLPCRRILRPGRQHLVDASLG